MWEAAVGLGVGGLLGVALTWLLFKFFFSSYLAEKGKNLATKEDISEITEKLENVKVQFTQAIGYLGEKGKNLATKEDIAGITREIEAVKLEYTMLAVQFKAQHQLRLAALDRRLQAQQQAFALWRRLVRDVYSDQIGATVHACQVWWEENCLYLEPAAREAFSAAYATAHSYKRVAEAPRREDHDDFLVKRWERIEAAGQIILESVALPRLTPTELADNAIPAAPTK